MNHRAMLPLVPLALSVAACGSSSEPGVEVRVISEPARLVSEEPLASVDGEELRLSELFWTTTAVELVPCDSLAQKLWDVIVPSAHAHGVTSPRRLALPVVERATAQEPVALGTLRPPAGRYCSVRYEVGTADADAVGLDSVPAMQGRSLDAVGEFRESGAEAEPFEITSRVALHVLRPVELELSEANPHATVRIERSKLAWFVGLGRELDAAARERLLLDNLAASTTIRAE